MTTPKNHIVIGILLALSVFPGQAQEPYRQYVKHPDSIAKASADVSGTYKYWKDTGNINEALLINDQAWKLNSKWQDEPFDDSLHGGHVAMDRGEEVYDKLNANGEFANCIGASNGHLDGLRANHYPRFNEQLNHVTGLEEMIELCADKQGKTLLNGSYDNSAISVYIGSFSNGMAMNVNVSEGELKLAFERGEKLFFMRTGWTNFACGTCHVTFSGKHLRGQTPTTYYGDAAHWPTFRVKNELQSLHLRFTECNRSGGTQPIAIGSREYTDLEVYLTGLSNGQPVRQPSVRN